MKHKKILLTLFIFTLLTITLALSVSALGNYGDYNGRYNQVASQLNLQSNYMDLSWLHMAETTFRNDTNQIIDILFFTVDVSALTHELQNSDFVSSGQSAVEFLNFMSLGSIGAFYNSNIWYTNLDAVIGQINAVGEVIVLNSSNEALSSENDTLYDENVELESKIDTLTSTNSELEDENSRLHNTCDALTSEMAGLSSTITELTTENRELKSTNEELTDQLNNSSGGYIGAINTMRSWFRERGYSYTTVVNSSFEDIFKNELEINVLELKRISYLEGESAGLETSEVAKDSILSIISAPFYFFSNVFNFEIMGINIYSIISLLLTLAVLAFFFKKIKG